MHCVNFDVGGCILHKSNASELEYQFVISVLSFASPCKNLCIGLYLNCQKKIFHNQLFIASAIDEHFVHVVVNISLSFDLNCMMWVCSPSCMLVE